MIELHEVGLVEGLPPDVSKENCKNLLTKLLYLSIIFHVATLR